MKKLPITNKHFFKDVQAGKRYQHKINNILTEELYFNLSTSSNNLSSYDYHFIWNNKRNSLDFEGIFILISHE